MKQRVRIRCHLGMILSLVVATGCICSGNRTSWHPPTVAEPQYSFVCQGNPCSARPAVEASHRSSVSHPESAYATAFELEANGSAACVDYYYLAAASAWTELVNQLELGNTAMGRGVDLYHSSLSKLISAGQEYQRLDPARGLTIQLSDGCVHVPITYHGFPWHPDDFDLLVPVGDYRTKELNRIYSAPGLGIATVAQHSRRKDEEFRRKVQVFAATAVLRPTESQAGVRGFALELFDPVRISHVHVAHARVPLRRDLSAPFAFVLKNIRRNPIEGFIQPGSSANDTGLFVMEPYQPGKIPVVFVHGLLSDPYTWANIANELRARPDLMERYQIWGFEYATGEPFLKSAAVLREHLRRMQGRVIAKYGRDSALDHTVLVGHSMGGLVSKLQVTYSGDDVWAAMSNQPFETIVTPPSTRMHLAESAFFMPSPVVSRVVYVGTPHRGSPWARRSIGRLGARLVERPSSLEVEHAQLMRDNPNAFSREFTRRIPTSIDLLRPDSRLVQAIDRLPVAERVREHSLIGSFRPMLCAGDSDGVVPVASARRSNAVSERVIRARHEKIHQTPEAIEELIRILRLHMQEVQYRG